MNTNPLGHSATADHQAEVVVLGAGPVGLAIANYLGQVGIKVLLIEKLDKLIDYPRAIGIDDESLRTVQAIGLVDKVLPHTTPWHAMRFLTPKGRCFADIQPMTDEFGWSRRNAFIQPQVDAVLFDGLQRFNTVRTLFSRELLTFSQDSAGVSLQISAPDGRQERVRAKYLVACDGGNSVVRRNLGISFEGKTAPNQWIVVDIANDPLSTPNVYLCCDPLRPYVSAALPHGVRRFEFMVMPGETEQELSKPENMRKLLAKVLPDPDRVELIRSRVYTHNARLAGKFRDARIILAGDAAHIMPVWQGQGYNSGMRDASNLAWKLALVVKGLAGSSLLDTYEQERRDHAKAMIDLSVLAGHVLAPPKRWQGSVRDGISWLLNYLPPVKRYFLEMRFKPMPQYSAGALVQAGAEIKDSPIGRMFIQPRVLTDDGKEVLLDDVIGSNFALVAWGCDPTWGLTPAQIEFWRNLGTRFIQVLPSVQLQAPREVSDGVIRIGDSSGRLKEWFGRYPASIAVVRPDRFLAGLAIPQTIGQVCNDLSKALSAQPQTLPTATSKVA
ncbi:MAG: bifunctional 3-(3-hydroxy-phenyl)propionate/3-hydroxycinnamic acid hydroxylase [Gammaproteobacteria bacterium]|nr:bifunctional 3-(3-hydroxy-phenyl)propionate/3-hydroxycinnamic acid hydroxylase [Gammaproteobacteria bacterium]MBU0806670.1 bifunctional 3-(3-hydroxy-phenyl)propionate/3-hydroxycinnamic acid hydroxylase [Gammaproteobacteria bacterium]MBU0882510.1 bifunctional 3-(3-hydroxy-phenyl)propionate/3-hydroxycinnamic acid hydroxylase [Gammaproteobacteria bacterium]MBU1861101.1 bifunctional 3-(3-hydroxy-phenyl)propionate/3-hydroxycinnamic acid hydroxylase [Gammaproteobacteria bacterium]